MSTQSMHQTAMEQMHSESLVLSKADVARRLNCSKRQVDVLSRRYRDNIAMGENSLPSSPKNGLYRIELSVRMHRWDWRDIDEFLKNEHAERAGLKLQNWRKSNA